MRTGSLLAIASAAVLLAAVSLARGQAGSSLEPRDFKPARIAVVNISEVFENYDKKKDVEKVLEDEVKEEEKKFQEEQNALKKLQEELKNVPAGTEMHKTLTLDVQKKQYEMKTHQEDLVKRFNDKQLEALKEIRKEITDDIEKYAKGQDIDIVLEKQVTAEGKGNAIRWPIVHYAKPELEITAEITRRLNMQYGASRPAAPAKTATPSAAKK